MEFIFNFCHVFIFHFTPISAVRQSFYEIRHRGDLKIFIILLFLVRKLILLFNMLCCHSFAITIFFLSLRQFRINSIMIFLLKPALFLKLSVIRCRIYGYNFRTSHGI